jgi:hypothetical protein
MISYAREDRPVAQVLAQSLEAAGYDVFWDRELLSGSDFEQVLGAELATARAVVVLWSQASIRSGWVRDEAAAAMERGVLVPVLLHADITPPLGFRSLHTVVFNQGDLGELKRALVRRIATPSVAPTIVRPRPTWGIGVVESACLVLLVAAVLAFLLFTPR